MKVESSKYRGVRAETNPQQRYKGLIWVGQFSHKGRVQKKVFRDEREAAKWYDLQRIRAGLEPCNVLVRAGE